VVSNTNQHQDIDISFYQHYYSLKTIGVSEQYRVFSNEWRFPYVTLIIVIIMLTFDYEYWIDWIFYNPSLSLIHIYNQLLVSNNPKRMWIHVLLSLLNALALTVCVYPMCGIYEIYYHRFRKKHIWMSNED